MMALNTSIDSPRTIRVGSRKSYLALVQTEHVIQCLKDHHKLKYQFDLSTMETIGDKIQEKPLPEIGDKGLFTVELEKALLDNEIDLIVHSLKDLPTTLPEGCCIGAILKREDPSDAIVMKEGTSTPSAAQFLNGSFHESNAPTIGTSSLRRKSQLQSNNPKVNLIDIRGNINTRLDKLDGKKGTVHYDAIVLATAGLKRANLEHRISYKLGNDENWYYAVGQGALAVECRANDEAIYSLLKPIVDLKTLAEVVAERSLLYHLEGGCSVPIGVRSTWSSLGSLTLAAAVFSIDGSVAIKETMTMDVNLDGSSSSIIQNQEYGHSNDASGGDVANLNLQSEPSIMSRVDSESLLIGMICKFDELSPGFMLSCYNLGKELAKRLDKNGASVILKEIKKVKEQNKLA